MEVDRNLGSGGAVSLLRRWKEVEGLNPGGNCVPLSGGDLFTGPAISSASHGEAMIDVMNAMGYRVAAVGNHDLDYGVENLRQRAAQAQFPLLSANLRLLSTGALPDFIQPFTVIQVNDVSIGLIGLTTTETPWDTNPEAAAEFRFLPYAETLREFAPQVKAAGAQVLVVLGHICTNEMDALRSLAQQLGIQVLCGGHCHEVTHQSESMPVVVQSGAYLRGYTRIDLQVDLQSDYTFPPRVAYFPNPPGKVDQELADRVQHWKETLDPDLWRKIGYLRKKVDNQSAGMGRLLATSWLAAYPQAQIGLASPRQINSIPAGGISPATILSTLPTENTLVHLRLSGQQVLDTVARRHPIVGGSISPDALDPAAKYDVLIPDALYKGNNHYAVKALDPQAADTGISWRQPVVNWIEQQTTNKWQPLDDLLHGV